MYGRLKSHMSSLNDNGIVIISAPCPDTRATDYFFVSFLAVPRKYRYSSFQSSILLPPFMSHIKRLISLPKHSL